MTYVEDDPLLYLVIRREDGGLGVPRIVFEHEDMKTAEAKSAELIKEAEEAGADTIYRVETYGIKRKMKFGAF